MYGIIGSDGREYGPVEKDALIQWVREGRVVASTVIIDKATGQRFPASQMPELAALFNTGPRPGAPGTWMPPGQQPGGPYGPYGGSPYGPQPGVPGSPYGLAYNPYASPQAGRPPSTGGMLAISIILTLLTLCTCCLPVGLPSLIYTCMASSKGGRGDYVGAERDLAQARVWAWIAFVLWLLTFALGVIWRLSNPHAFSHYNPYGGF